MTLPVQESFNQSTANGVTKVFPYSFKVFAASHLVVQVAGVTVTTGFTVSGVGVEAGGNVTFTAAPANGAEVLIYRDIPLERSIAYVTNGTFPAATVNKDVDSLWMALQDARGTLAGGLRLPFPEEADEFPAAASRADRLISFDAATGAPEVSPFTVTQVASAVAAAYLGGAASTLDALAFTQSGTGAVARTAQAKMRERVSAADFGAVGDGVANDTAAIEAAIAALPARGGRVLFHGNGMYACNLVITKSNVTFEAENKGGGTGSPDRDFGLVPWTTTSPVLQIGNDTATVNGFTAQNLYLWRAGPNGAGDYGLRLAGGTANACFVNFRASGFSKKSVWIENGASFPIQYVFFTNYSIGVTAAATAEHALYVKFVAPQYTSAVFFCNGHVNAGGGGKTVEVDGATLWMTNSWLELSNGRGVKLTGTGKLFGQNVQMDSSSSSDVLVETTFSGSGAKLIPNFIQGGIAVDGSIQFYDGTTQSLSELSHFAFGSMTYNPVVSGNLFFTETTDSSKRDMKMSRSGTDMTFESPGAIRFVPGTGSTGRLIADSVTRFTWSTTAFQANTDNAYDLGASANRYRATYSAEFRPGAGATIWKSGAGTPEGAVAAPIGSMYTRTDGGAGTTLYIKESGAGNTGWVAK